MWLIKNKGNFNLINIFCMQFITTYLIFTQFNRYCCIYIVCSNILIIINCMFRFFLLSITDKHFGWSIFATNKNIFDRISYKTTKRFILNCNIHKYKYSRSIYKISYKIALLPATLQRLVRFSFRKYLRLLHNVEDQLGRKASQTGRSSVY